MTQFNKAEARRIFAEYPEANYVAQDEDGEVCTYSSNPFIEWRIWVELTGLGTKRIDTYTLHPDGWENSRYSRADMEGE